MHSMRNEESDHNELYLASGRKWVFGIKSTGETVTIGNFKKYTESIVKKL